MILQAQNFLQKNQILLKKTTSKKPITSSKKKNSSKKSSSKKDTSIKNSSKDEAETEDFSDEEISSKKDETSKEKTSSKTKTSSKKASSKKSSSKKSSSKKSSSEKSSSKEETSSAKSSSVETSSTTTSQSQYPARQRSINIRKANQHFFKKVGRWIVNANNMGVGLNWTCSSVEFNVDCIGELGLDFEKTGSTALYLKIYIDGELVEERTNVAVSGIVTIATDLEAGVHNVKIIRSSDCESGALTLNKIWLRGKLVEENFDVKDNSLYIEAIGDASLIGWGARLEDSFFENIVQSTARSKENQDGTIVYPYVAAEKLGADAYVVAKQGVGVAATYHGPNANSPCNARNGLLPTIYKYAASSGSTQYTIDRVPDVFVIDAGAADLNEKLQKWVEDGDKMGIDTPRAVEISVEFLNYLKGINPNAKIIWCYGFTGENSKLEEYVLNIVSKAGGTEKGIYSLKLPKASRKEYASAKEHEAAADVLAEKISQITK